MSSRMYTENGVAQINLQHSSRLTSITQGGDLVPSLPLGVSEIWMEMGTFTSETGADGVWPYGHAFKIARHYGYNI